MLGGMKEKRERGKRKEKERERRERREGGREEGGEGGRDRGMEGGGSPNSQIISSSMFSAMENGPEDKPCRILRHTSRT